MIEYITNEVRFMRHVSFVIVFSFFSLTTAAAQDSILTVKEDNIGFNHVVNIDYEDFWVFKRGHDPSWANPDISTQDWQPFQSSQLNRQSANQEGVVEGWLRIKLKKDKSLSDRSLIVNQQGWMASDIYLDGIKVQSFGNIGSTSSNTFQEYNPSRTYHEIIPPLDLVTDSVHLLAIHFKDELGIITGKLKSDMRGAFQIYDLMPTDKVHESVGRKYYESWRTNTTIIFLIALQFILLWLFYKQEYFIKYIATYTIILLGLAGTLLFEWLPGPSNDSNRILHIIFQLSYSAMAVYTPYLVAKLLGYPLSKVQQYALLLILLILLIFQFLENPLFIGLSTVVALLFTIYIIAQRWKQIAGPQWAVVIGVLVLIMGAVLQFNAPQMGFAPETLEFISFATLFICFLSFPFSLLVFLALRYKASFENIEQQVKDRTVDLNTSLEHLKATQTQLIQSEKMASLGELTAGIAHEIQNPLNFVNNFSEVTNELLDEVDEELVEGNIEDAREIITDLKQNLSRISHHGDRASNIVKNMLVHARVSSDEKAAIDINAICEENVRLSYLGIRSKDKLFTAAIKTYYGEGIPLINGVPQDIGRVLLNVLNNAFYAVDEKRKILIDGSSTSDEEATHHKYKPLVTITTLLQNKSVSIAITDNGTGIPKDKIDKIFQPFFTTKPTGSGTGLGLSISYDIIQAHKGKLEMETSTEGTTFTIHLPIS